MPSPKIHRKAGEKNKIKGMMRKTLSEKSSSFHGRDDGAVVAAEMILRRPRTAPDLFAGRRSAEDAVAIGAPAKLTKLLLNVTIHRCLGAVRVVVPLEATVEDLIAAALRQYAKEARLPVIPPGGASDFDLHYSQFSLESLDRDEKLNELGSRNFFLYPKKAAAEVVAATARGGASTSRCSEEVDRGSIKKGTWLKFMDFLL
ncbi:hypothetical protein ABFS82_04G205200 [Erythranthe guttata]|uniref:DUF7054 domain-containing protein n=1 Tax=Erythranthe guttata TaxID=4155 RepID=A0A022R9I5_ERYGU|nr:PREDICTED: uncharacterized protein At4g22758-like [Erythranthe guttata]EYU36977.1 hypothetical protein MIMGU_mgv1a014088mg [Erythranthe guttata]|eukprot:XP_012837958.1 PREDICTED: uncharacterized protein At4g22758-like [Erythranthe guttata]